MTRIRIPCFNPSSAITPRSGGSRPILEFRELEVNRIAWDRFKAACDAEKKKGAK